MILLFSYLFLSCLPWSGGRTRTCTFTFYQPNSTALNCMRVWHLYVNHQSICHGWTRLIPPPSSFGVSTGEILTAVPPRFKVPSAFPGLSAASFAATAHPRPPRGSHTAGQVSEESSPCQGTLLWQWEMQESNLRLVLFSLVAPRPGPGLSRPSALPAPGRRHCGLV